MFCSSNSSHLWHCRIGHYPFDKMKLLDFMATGTVNHDICTICPKAKMTRCPFPSSHIKTWGVFYIIHIDI